MSTFQIDFGNDAEDQHIQNRRHRPGHHQQPGRRDGPDRSAHSLRASCPAWFRSRPSGEVIVGSEAREMLITHPERTVYSVKRLMGRGVGRRAGRAQAVSRSAWRAGSESVLQAAAGRQDHDAARSLGAHPAQAEARCRSRAWRARHASRDHRSRLFQRRAAAGDQRRRPHRRVWKCCAW